MIYDFTTIETFPAAEIVIKENALLRLQNVTITTENGALTNTNKGLRNSLITIVVLGIITGGYLLYKKYKEDETK